MDQGKKKRKSHQIQSNYQMQIHGLEIDLKARLKVILESVYNIYNTWIIKNFKY